VVEGFVLAAPVYGGVGQAVGSTVYFPLYNTNITLQNPTRTLNISPTDPNATGGYEHIITIGEATYSYLQQVISDGSGGNAPDWVLTIAQALANQINAADPNATASAVSTGIILSPRLNTGASVPCGAPNDGAQTGMLIELVGNELIPTISKGMLFAQGVAFDPSSAPALPAAPASQKSWLYYNSTGGFYWSASSSPTASDDACIGWVVTTSTEIVAISSSKIGTGQGAVALPGGPVALAIGTAASSDTGPPIGTLGFSAYVWDPEVGVEKTPGMLQIGNIGWDGAVANLDGVDALTFLLYATDEAAGPIATLAGAAGAADTSLSLSNALPAAAAAQSVVFTFMSSGTLAGGVTVGPGYAHTIKIGSATYAYIQQTPDTAATIALALAEAIQAAVDINAMATANGATVILTPLETNGNTVVCSASDGNAAATMIEAQPAYYLIDDGASGEIVLARATDGTQIVRAQKGSTATTHAAGALVWQISVTTVFEAWDCVQAETPATPTSRTSGGYTTPIIGLPTRSRAHRGITTSSVFEIPFARKSLVAIDGWASNEYGDSAITERNYSTGVWGGRLSSVWAGQITWQGPWNAGTAYQAGDMASYSGQNYMRIVPGTTATAPSADATNWEVSPLTPAVSAPAAPTLPASTTLSEVGSRVMIGPLNRTQMTLQITWTTPSTGPAPLLAHYSLNVPAGVEGGAGDALVQVSGANSFIQFPAWAPTSGQSWSATISLDTGQAVSATITSAAVTINAIGSAAATDVTGATIGALVGNTTADGVQYWGCCFNATIGASDPNFWTSKITIQWGKYVSGAWTPRTGSPTLPANDPGIVQVDAVGTFNLFFNYQAYPPDTYNIAQFKWWVRSRAGDDTTAWVLQVNAFGAGVDHYNLTVVVPAASIPSSRISPATWGSGIYQDRAGNAKVDVANPSNMLQNGGFEDGAAAWTSSGAVAIVSVCADSTAPYTGSYCAQISAPTTNIVQGDFTCRPGDRVYVEEYLRIDAGTVAGGPIFVLRFLNAAGGIVQDFTVDPAVTTTWTKFVNAATAPAGACYFQVHALYTGTFTSGAFYIDNVLLRPVVPGTQLALGTALGTDGSGNAVVKLGSTLATDGSGNAVVAPASLTQGNIYPGALSNPMGGAWGALAAPPVVNYGLPSWTAYNTGQILVDNSSPIWKIYRNSGYPNGWIPTTDPADLIAGSLAAGVVLTGSVTVTSGTVTVNIDGTNFVRVSDSQGTWPCTAQMANTGFQVSTTRNSAQALLRIAQVGNADGELFLKSHDGSSSLSITPEFSNPTGLVLAGYLAMAKNGVASYYIPYYVSS
jgi:hypothetical protein